MLNYRCLFVWLFFLVSSWCFAQSEVQLKAEAEALFNVGKYQEATSMYTRLLAINPRSNDYNYHYGTCLLFQSNKKQESLKYFRIAAQDTRTLPAEFHYFFAKSLHVSYMFNEAIKEYRLYSQKRLKDTPFFDVDRAIQECENGRRLMSTITNIIVTDRKEMPIDKFFRIYDLSKIGGNLLVTAEFQSKIDKKNKHVPLIYFPENPAVIYYSSYGDKGENGMDIYVRRKLPNNSWGLPQALQGGVNTQFDENFPFMHPDGSYLYFSSKGHNTMGGYDVFRSKYDPETNTFSKPENMDYAISSPEDDIFYVTDSSNQNAIFASSRQSPQGFPNVYKVKMDRVPIQAIVIKGHFFSSIDTTIKKINFTIRDYSSGEFIGKYNSNERGVYILAFPKGGKYEFIMKLNNSTKEYRSVVSVPFLNEFKALKQQIQHFDEQGSENVKIVNQFDIPINETVNLLVEIVQKRSEESQGKGQSGNTSNDNLSDLGVGKLNLIEVSYQFQNQVTGALQNKYSSEKLNSNINNLILESVSDILSLEEQIEDKMAQAASTTNQEQQYKLFKEAQLLVDKQSNLKSYSRQLVLLRDSVSSVISASVSIKELDKLKQLSTEFDKLISQGNQNAALNLLSTNHGLLLSVLQDTSADLMGNLVDQVITYDNLISPLEKRLDEFSRQERELDVSISTLKSSFNSGKNTDIVSINAKIASLEIEKVRVQNERDSIQKSIQIFRNERFKLSHQRELLKDAMSNKSAVWVSDEQSKEALLKIEHANKQSLKSMLEHQVNEIEKLDPTISSRLQLSTILSANQIYFEYSKVNQEVDLNTSLSEQEKLELKLANENSHLRLITKGLAELSKREQTSKLSSENLAERHQLLIYESELILNAQKHEKMLKSLEPVSPSVAKKQATTNVDQLIKEVPIYKKENPTNPLTVENSNKPVVNEMATVQRMKEVDSKVPTRVETIENVDKQMVIESVMVQKTKDETKLDSKTAVKVTNYQNERTNEIETIQKTESKCIAKVNPNYFSELSVLKSNVKLDEIEKRVAIQVLDKALIHSMDEKIIQLKKDFKNDSTNQILSDELKDFLEVRSNLESTYNEHAQLIHGKLFADFSEQALIDLQRKVIEDVCPGYFTEKQSFDKEKQSVRSFKNAELILEEKLGEKLRERSNKLLIKSDNTPFNLNKARELQLVSQLLIENEVRKKALIKEVERLHLNDSTPLKTNKMETETTDKLIISQVSDSLKHTQNNKGTSSDSLAWFKLKEQQEALKVKFEQSTLSKKERKEIVKQIKVLEIQSLKEEQMLCSNKMEMLSKTSTKYTDALNECIAKTDSTNLEAKLAFIQKRIADEEISKNSENAQQTKSVASNTYLMKEALKKQEQAVMMLNESLIAAQLEEAQKETGATSLETVKQLEAKKRKYTIQIGELTKIVDSLAIQIATSKGQKSKLLVSKQNTFLEQREILEKQRVLVDEKLRVLTETNASKNLVNSGVEPASVQNEEVRKIVLSEAYKNYFDQIKPAHALEQEMVTLAQALETSRSESQEISIRAVNTPTQENKVLLLKHAEKIATLEKQYIKNQKAVVSIHEAANMFLPVNTNEAKYWNELARQGVEPIQRTTVFQSVMPMQERGLEIAKDLQYKLVTKVIPVNVKNPSGLVYRVQVGAFSKPIPEDRFKEFNPVSGETLANGITRYLAGYFNSSANVIEARDKIRNIGYADAFAIAYCDGKRISMAEARTLEASGKCVPMGNNDLSLEVATNTIEKMEDTLMKINLVSSSKKLNSTMQRSVPDVDYTMVPGGVRSERIEKHLGLFYTVQVGVFNNPVNANAVKRMQPLMSLRLANGLIRYSSGMFTSVNDAKQKKIEAISKGINDAFITAYYKSKRISLAEAERLLAKYGKEILEKHLINDASYLLIQPVQKSEVNPLLNVK